MRLAARYGAAGAGAGRLQRRSHPAETLRDLPGPFDVAFYTAGADRRSEAGYRSAYLEGLGNLIGALQRQKPPVRRLFFTSSTAVYGQSGGEWVDEDSPTEAGHFRGRLLRDAEQVLLGGPIAGTVVRVGGIYGPGRQRLIDSVRRGEACCFEGPPRYLNHVHRDDCAGALAHLMGLDSPRPSTCWWTRSRPSSVRSCTGSPAG